MCKQKIVIRADGNSNIGLGHIYRGIALAEMLKDEFTIEFIIRFDTTILPIQNVKFNYVFIPESITLLQEPAWFKKNYTTDTIIILDGYDFTESYQKQIKEFNFKLVYIDDLAKGNQKADLVINHSPGIKESDYKKEDYTDLALGLNYALLRKPFIEFGRNEVKIRKEIKNVFVSFGGADINDFSFSTVNEINKLEFLDEINVVIGAAYKHDAIFKLRNSKIKIHKNITSTEVFMIMKDADLAIVPASTISIELASLGVPMILGYSIYNQKGIYSGFIKNGAAFAIGDFREYKFEKLKKDIIKNISEKQLEIIQNKLLIMFNGNIKENIISKIDNLC